jgi:stringent starvation protein B
MKEISTRPYLIRAIYEWCLDSGYTPYLSVRPDDHTRVPPELVKKGEIILNISSSAAHHLTLGNDVIQFSARFNGVSREISIPVEAVQGIFAKETSQGILFAIENEAGATPGDPSEKGSPALVKSGGKRRLQVVK